jgi:hypothetical protein
MALFKRLLILAAAGAGAAWFLKQRREAGEQPVFGDAGATSGAGAAPSDIGDAATAGSGTSETLQEAGTDEPEPPAADAPVEEPTPPAEDAGAGETTAAEQPTRVGNPVMPDTSADALVRKQEDAAAAEAGSIGGEPEEHETLEEADRDLGAGRERQD